MFTLPLIALASFSGCTGTNPFTFSGVPIPDLFPFDGLRHWEFTSTDTSVRYRLVAEMLPEDPDTIDGRTVYTVDYFTECVAQDGSCVDGELLRSLMWASDGSDGVFVYGYDNGSGLVELSPPVQIGTDAMKRGDVVESTTDGTTWSSEMMGLEPCPVNMNVAWDDCGKFEVTAADGDGSPIAGTYWANAGFNVVAFEWSGDETGQWGLSNHECLEECDGVW